MNVNFRAQNNFDVPAVTKTKREKTHDLNSITLRDIHQSLFSVICKLKYEVNHATFECLRIILCRKLVVLGWFWGKKENI